MRYPIHLSSNYAETRRPTSEQRTVNMYPHSLRGFRQFPGLVDFTTYAAPVYNSASLDMSAEIGLSDCYSAYWNNDGTKLIVNDSLYLVSYTTATPYSIAGLGTPVSSSPTQLGGAGGATRMTLLNDDGTILTQLRNDSVFYKNTLATGFDVTTMADSGVGTATITASQASTGDSYIDWTSDGYGCVVFDDLSQVYQYTCGSHKDMTGGAYASKTFDASSEIPAGSFKNSGIAISSDGRNMFLSSWHASLGGVYQYFLAIKDDISSAQLIGRFNPTAELDKPSALVFNPAGTQFGLVDRDSAVMFEYTSSAFSLAAGASQSGAGRGMKVMNGTAYAVIGTTLYSISPTGASQTLGTIAGQRVGMETDGTQLVITTAATVYLYTVAAGLVTITDADLNDTANTSAYLDLRFYYDQPSGQFVSSAVDDASNIDALDFATAESVSDDLLSVYAHNRYLYLFGETSIEVWFTSQGRPPVDREQVIERGIIGSHAVNSIDNKMYFVDQERRPNVMSGLEYLPIGSPSLGIEWDTYTTVDDCIVQTYSWHNENFVEFIFPTQDVSWTLHEPSGEWVEREDIANTRFNSVAYVNAYGKTLACDKTNGKIYQLSDTTYQDDGSNITRLIQTGLITSEVLGQPDRSMTIDTLYLTLESTGAGTISVAAAYDGGSFGTARDITVAAGVETYSLSGWGECREVIFQLSTTSNIGLDLISGSVEGEVLHD